MRVNIWIRKENEELWSGIADKSEFVNALLRTHDFGEKTSHEAIGRLHDKINARVAERAEKASKEDIHAVAKRIRTKGDILKEIDEMKAECQDKLEYCQDSIEINKINEDYKKVIDSLWEEYNASN